MTDTASTTTPRCPACGADRIVGATFCESCGTEFGSAATVSAGPATALSSPDPGPAGPEDVAAPVTAAPGEESPLDVGWTGVDVVASTASAVEDPAASQNGAVCRRCGQGHFLDGYCDTCGAKEPDPRDHFAEQPASWVAGVCDIGRRHRRNEDGMALHAESTEGSYAALVVCDGVSNSTDSHVASLAAARAARDVLASPIPRGVGTHSALVGAATQRLDAAVDAAQQAVVTVTQGLRETGGLVADSADGTADNPPSCTFVAAVVVGGGGQGPELVVVGNVGDSRAYWIPDGGAETVDGSDATAGPVGRVAGSAGRGASQLSQDDSFAAEQMSAGVPRKEAETGPGAHAITRWLGVDNGTGAGDAGLGSPDSVAPHIADLAVDVTTDGPGWLLVCSDGLWNYCSDAGDLQALVHERAAALAKLASGVTPSALAESLVDFANECGGTDNISVALARLGGPVVTVRPGDAAKASPGGPAEDSMEEPTVVVPEPGAAQPQPGASATLEPVVPQTGPDATHPAQATPEGEDAP